MVGLLTTIVWSLDQEEEYILAGYEATVQRWIASLGDLPGITVERGYPSEAGQPHGRAIVHIAPPRPAHARRDRRRTLGWHATDRCLPDRRGRDRAQPAMPRGPAKSRSWRRRYANCCDNRPMRQYRRAVATT